MSDSVCISRLLACKCSPFVKYFRGVEAACVVEKKEDVTDKARRSCLFNSLTPALVAFSPLVITPGFQTYVELVKEMELKSLTIPWQENGVNTVDEIYRVTYYGKGKMPGFGETCTPRGQCTFGPRLKEEDIKLLAEFVKLQADQGWVDIGKYGD